MHYMNGWLETADVTATLPPLEIEKLSTLETYAKRNRVSDETAGYINGVMMNVPDWLPFAAEIYKTSANVKDYFVVPTIIMPSDLPNRNGAAFPLTELTKFSPDIGDLTYKGWKGKPVHIEHQNTDPTKAIGAVVDVSMRKIKDTNLWKVITLLAIDKTKRPDISDEILAGRRTNYSMGAMVKGHVCSVCGAKSLIKPTHKTRYDGLECKESHGSFSRHNTFREFSDAQGNKIIGYLNVHGIMPIEVSSVKVPAYVSAETNYDHIQSF